MMLLFCFDASSTTSLVKSVQELTKLTKTSLLFHPSICLCLANSSQRPVTSTLSQIMLTPSSTQTWSILNIPISTLRHHWEVATRIGEVYYLVDQVSCIAYRPIRYERFIERQHLFHLYTSKSLNS